MSGSRRRLRRRFKAMNSNKKRRIITVISVVAAVAIICGAGWLNIIMSERSEIYGTAENVNYDGAWDAVSENTDKGIANAGKNPYNDICMDVTGRTIADVAADEGITVEELIASYELPADMPADTTESAAYYMVPCRKIAEMYGMSGTEELKQTVGIPDFVTDDTPWGEALDETTLGSYIGAHHLDEFKETFGMGDEVTADTKWKEVRDIVDAHNIRMRMEQGTTDEQIAAQNE